MPDFDSFERGFRRTTVLMGCLAFAFYAGLIVLLVAAVWFVARIVL